MIVKHPPTLGYTEHRVAFTLMIGITLFIPDSSHSPTSNHIQACEMINVWSNQQYIFKCDQASTSKSMRESSGDEVGTTTATIMVKKSGNWGKADRTNAGRSTKAYFLLMLQVPSLSSNIYI